MNIDENLYSTQPFYKQLIDHTVQMERERAELQHQIDSIKREMAAYANQLPYHTMTQISPYTWSAPYSTFNSNYENFWKNKYPLNQQNSIPPDIQSFKTAIDAAALLTKDTNPVASIVFDGIGIMTSKNLFEVALKTLSIIDKARKL